MSIRNNRINFGSNVFGHQQYLRKTEVSARASKLNYENIGHNVTKINFQRMINTGKHVYNNLFVAFHLLTFIFKRGENLF